MSLQHTTPVCPTLSYLCPLSEGSHRVSAIKNTRVWWTVHSPQGLLAFCAGLHNNTHTHHACMLVQVQDVHEEAGGPTCLSILRSLMAKSRMFMKKLVAGVEGKLIPNQRSTGLSQGNSTETIDKQ